MTLPEPRTPDQTPSLQVALQLLDESLPVPGYAQPGDAGADLSSAEDLVLEPGERALVSTGVAIALPEGYVGLVHPRSGLAARHGISIVNAPGTIDAGYRGEILVNLINLDRTASMQVNRGDRIAQLLVQKFEIVELVETDVLTDSVRGDTGHGSTGGFDPAGADPATADE